jgi:hypothetical protein
MVQTQLVRALHQNRRAAGSISAGRPILHADAPA